jgi:hypothetical protein
MECLLWHEPSDPRVGVLEARLSGLRLRVVAPARAIRTDKESYLAWVDAFRRTFTAPDAHASLDSAKRAAVELALAVVMAEQDQVRQRLEHAPTPLLEEDLQTLNELLLALLREAERSA